MWQLLWSVYVCLGQVSLEKDVNHTNKTFIWLNKGRLMNESAHSPIGFWSFQSFFSLLIYHSLCEDFPSVLTSTPDFNLGRQGKFRGSQWECVGHASLSQPCFVIRAVEAGAFGKKVLPGSALTTVHVINPRESINLCLCLCKAVSLSSTCLFQPQGVPLSPILINHDAFLLTCDGGHHREWDTGDTFVHFRLERQEGTP